MGTSAQGLFQATFPVKSKFEDIIPILANGGISLWAQENCPGILLQLPGMFWTGKAVAAR